MATCSAVCVCLREVGRVRADDQYHVRWVESYHCVRMCHQVIHDLFCFQHGVVRTFRLITGDCAEGHENGVVHRSGVIEDASDDALHMLDIIIR